MKFTRITVKKVLDQQLRPICEASGHGPATPKLLSFLGIAEFIMEVMDSGLDL